MTAAAGTLIHVAALTSGRNDPSARFRVRQHIAPLSEKRIHVSEYFPRIDKHAGIPSQLRPFASLFPDSMANAAWRGAKLAFRVPGILASHQADLIWLNRELLPGYYSLERYLKRPIVLDVDDAVWHARPNGVKTMRRLGADAIAIIAGNRYIADWFSQSRVDGIHIVPTAIDSDRFLPAAELPTQRTRSTFKVGWTGTAGNFHFLEAIEKPLGAFLDKVNGKFLVVAERAPSFRFIPARRIEYRPWSADSEASVLWDMDVGLMPLTDNSWTRGKCSFKMLQYMSAGIPVVVSPVGMNEDVLHQAEVGYGAKTEAEWYDALLALYEAPENARIMGKNGRELILRDYSVKVVNEKLAAIFASLA